MYLLPSLNMKLRPQILALRPGTRIVRTPSTWKTGARRIHRRRRPRVYLWIVPANIAGRWSLELSGGASDKLSLKLRPAVPEDRRRGVSRLGPRGSARAAPLRFRISFAYVDLKGVRRDFSGA